MTPVRLPRALALPALVGPFCDSLLAVDLPRLPASRRAATVEFVTGRVQRLPGPLHVGVVAVAALVRGAAIVAPRRVTRLLARRPLPLVGEYVRMLRSLAYTYIWETWPATAHDGRPR